MTTEEDYKLENIDNLNDLYECDILDNISLKVSDDSDCQIADIDLFPIGPTQIIADDLDEYKENTLELQKLVRPIKITLPVVSPALSTSSSSDNNNTHSVNNINNNNNKSNNNNSLISAVTEHTETSTHAIKIVKKVKKIKRRKICKLCNVTFKHTADALKHHQTHVKLPIVCLTKLSLEHIKQLCNTENNTSVETNSENDTVNANVASYSPTVPEAIKALNDNTNKTKYTARKRVRAPDYISKNHTEIQGNLKLKLKLSGSENFEVVPNETEKVKDLKAKIPSVEEKQPVTTETSTTKPNNALIKKDKIRILTAEEIKKDTIQLLDPQKRPDIPILTDNAMVVLSEMNPQQVCNENQTNNITEKLHFECPTLDGLDQFNATDTNEESAANILKQLLDPNQQDGLQTEQDWSGTNEYISIDRLAHMCSVCHSSFPMASMLYEHEQLTGHSKRKTVDSQKQQNLQQQQLQPQQRPTDQKTGNSMDIRTNDFNQTIQVRNTLNMMEKPPCRMMNANTQSGPCASLSDMDRRLNMNTGMPFAMNQMPHSMNQRPPLLLFRALHPNNINHTQGTNLNGPHPGGHISEGPHPLGSHQPRPNMPRAPHPGGQQAPPPPYGSHSFRHSPPPSNQMRPQYRMSGGSVTNSFEQQQQQQQQCRFSMPNGCPQGQQSQFYMAQQQHQGSLMPSQGNVEFSMGPHRHQGPMPLQQRPLLQLRPNQQQQQQQQQQFMLQQQQHSFGQHRLPSGPSMQKNHPSSHPNQQRQQMTQLPHTQQSNSQKQPLAPQQQKLALPPGLANANRQVQNINRNNVEPVKGTINGLKRQASAKNGTQPLTGNNLSPPAKRFNMDKIITDKDSGEMIIMQPSQNIGLPIIKSVQCAAENNSNASNQQTANSNSSTKKTIQLNDQITVSVKSKGQTKEKDPKDVADILANRGITVTPTSKTSKSESTSDGEDVQQLNGDVSIIAKKKTTTTVDLTDDQQDDVIEVPCNNLNDISEFLSCPLPECKEKFAKNLFETLHAHVKKVHQLSFKKCRHCQLKFLYEKDLIQHEKKVHGTLSTPPELGIPIVDLTNETTRNKLTSLGIHHYIPLGNVNQNGRNIYGFPIISMQGADNIAIFNLQNLGVSNILPIGPAVPIQSAKRPNATSTSKPTANGNK